MMVCSGSVDCPNAEVAIPARPSDNANTVVAALHILLLAARRVQIIGGKGNRVLYFTLKLYLSEIASALLS